MMPIFGHFSCHWLLVNAQPPHYPLPLLLTGVWVQWKLEAGEARWGLSDTALPHGPSHPTECPWGIQRVVKGELEGLVGFRAG